MINFEMIGTVLTSGENQVYLTGYKRSTMADEMNKISTNFIQFLPQAKELIILMLLETWCMFLQIMAFQFLISSDWSLETPILLEMEVLKLL